MAHIKSRKHPIGRRLNCSAAVAMAVMAFPGAVYAQQANDSSKSTGTLPQITVQGASPDNYKADAVASPKFTQPLVDTPQTISVIKKELFQQQNATTLTEALRNTPGVSIQLGENGNTQTGDSIFLRGFDTTSSIFVDGIRDLGGISRDLFNLEQVEVVKGPSGSDNGRGASSGYVNLVSKFAQNDNFSLGSVTTGTDNRYRATADLNRKLDLGIPGSAFRLNLMNQNYDTPGRDDVKNKRWGVAPSLSFGLGTPTRTSLNYLHLEQQNTPDGGVPTYGKNEYPFTATRNVGVPPVTVIDQIGRGPAVDSSNYYGVKGDHDNVTVDMFTVRVEHDIAPGTTIRNTTRIGQSKQDLVITGVGNISATNAPVNGNPATFRVPRSRQARDQLNEIATNQTNLTTEFDTGFVKHTLSTGVEFIYERQRTKTPDTVSGTASLYNPNSNDVMANPRYTGVYTDGDTFTAAAYAFDTLKLSEQWMLNAGVRVDKFKTTTDSAAHTDALAAPNPAVRNPSQELKDTLVSWKVGAVFKPATNGSIYAGWSVSYQPPGGANNGLSSSGTNQANASFDPQKGMNVELGTKWELFDNRVSATAAIYRSENSNELVSDGAANPTFTQIGKRRVDGVELGLVGLITPNLNISTGLAYMDSKIIKGTTANQGGVIVFSPKVTFTSWLTYKLPMVPGLTVGGGARYIDTAARSSNATVPTNLLTIPDYWVADAMVSYDVTKNLSLQLNINNMFDKNYISSLNNGGSRYRPGEERNALLTANLKF
jgi:catecholate siderophore receptor